MRCELAAQWAGLLSTPQPPHAIPKLLVGRVRVDDGRERRRVTREPLREEEVAGGPVHVRDGGVAEGVETVEPVEAGDRLLRVPGDLDAPLGDPPAGLGAEEGSGRRQRLSSLYLVRPQPLVLLPEMFA